MTVEAIAVVIPARDEEVLLSACLDALGHAVAEVEVPVAVVVVLDSCVDGSAAVVSSYPWVSAVVVEACNVGVARHAGVGAALEALGHLDPSSVWLATTDADSVVPVDWLSGQLALARSGADVFVGTVEVNDWADQPDGMEGRWRASYLPVEQHPHVHGANIGLSAAVYLDSDGFLPMACDEDVALIAAMTERHVVRTATLPVVTSARRFARAVGGFSDALRDLAG